MYLDHCDRSDTVKKKICVILDDLVKCKPTLPKPTNSTARMVTFAASEKRTKNEKIKTRMTGLRILNILEKVSQLGHSSLDQPSARFDELNAALDLLRVSYSSSPTLSKDTESASSFPTKPRKLTTSNGIQPNCYLFLSRCDVMSQFRNWSVLCYE